MQFLSRSYIVIFLCIRCRGGFNNNRNVIKFRKAIKQILLRTGVCTAKYEGPAKYRFFRSAIISEGN